MEEFLSFRKMITPTIIWIIFWVGCGIAILFGLVIMVTSFGRYSGGALQFLGGLLAIVIGPVIVRIACEQIILFFRINETLSEIRSDLKELKPQVNQPKE
jgi:hypothetical protein